MVECTSDREPTAGAASIGAPESGRPTGLEVIRLLVRLGLFAVGAYAVLGLTFLFDDDPVARSAYFWFFAVTSAAILLPPIGALLLVHAWRSLGIRGARRISWALTLLAPCCAIHHVGPLALLSSVAFSGHTEAEYRPDPPGADIAGCGTYVVTYTSFGLSDSVDIGYRSPWTLGFTRTIAIPQVNRDLFPSDVSLRLTPDALEISVSRLDRPLSIPRREIGWLLVLGPRVWEGDEVRSSFGWTPFDALDSLLLLVVVLLLRRKIRAGLLQAR